MGKKDAETVPAPDPSEVAAADARYNRIDQRTPYGDLTYSGPDRNIATLSLSPEMQNLFDTRIGVDQGLVNEGQYWLNNYNRSPIDLNQYGPIQSDAGLEAFDPSSLNMPAIPTDLEGYRSQLEDAYMSRMTRLVNPQFEEAQRQLDDTMANRGFVQNDAAWMDQQDQFNRNRFNQYSDIAERAVLGSGQEMTNFLAQALGARGQMFNEGMMTNQLNNQWRQQGLVNQNAGRSQGLNEALQLNGNDFNRLASFLGLQQVQPAQLQNFFAPGQTDVTGAYGLAQQANMFNAQQQNQMSAAGMTGLFGLGSAGINAYGMRA